MRTIAAWMILLVSYLTACNDTPARAIRKATYPPTFEYVERKAVRSNMSRIATLVSKLDENLRADSEARRAHRGDIRALLEDLRNAVGELDVAGETSNHPMRDAKFEILRKDIEAAQAGLERDPPDYYFAGTLVGSCVYCHR